MERHGSRRAAEAGHASSQKGAVRRQRRWRDANEAAAQLTSSERDALATLIGVPLAPVKLLEQLGGLFGGAAVYRRIARLRTMGLVAMLRPPIQPRYSLGLATLAVSYQIDVTDLVRRYRLHGSDLLSRLPGLPTLLASYRLPGALAMAGPGWPRLRGWEQPCRRRFRRPTAKALSRLELPARAVLTWDDQRSTYLLIPDLDTAQPRIYRPMLHQLHALRRAVGEPSRLVIATASRRVGAWEGLLEDVARSRHEAPLRVWIARWETLDVDLEQLLDVDKPRPMAAQTAAQSVQMPRPPAPRADVAIPRLVGDLTSDAGRPRIVAACLGRLALDLTPSDATMLDLVSRHSFLPLDGLTVALGWSIGRTRRQRDELVRRGLVRLPRVTTDRSKTLELAELTADGSRLAAARLGFPLNVAVQVEGLAGGGPDEPIGNRQSLVKNLTHTLGADAVFTHLYSLAARSATRGDELVVWDGPGACSHGRVRPDGYGVYRRAGRFVHFCLEYVRGTSGIRPLLRKLNAYYEYLETGRFRRDYPCFPVVLVVTTSNGAEARFAKAARAASIGRYARLPLLLTTVWRIFSDPTNRDGLLGPIWREADTPFDQRRRWIEDAPVAGV